MSVEQLFEVSSKTGVNNFNNYSAIHHPLGGGTEGPLHLPYGGLCLSDDFHERY